jgi:DNA-binding transcriptional LysR family regulator
MLNLDHLQTFRLVVETGSFSAAADRLGLSQPAVSLHIKQLEAGLKSRLLERVGRRAKPTAAGVELLTQAHQVHASVEGLLRAMASHSAEVSGNVSIGTGATACLYFLPRALQSLRARYPRLHVLVRTGNTADFVRAVEDNTLDLALVTLPVRSRSLAVVEIMDDEFVAIGPREAKLPQRLTPAGLSRRPLVLFEPAANTRVLIDEWFGAAGDAPVPVMELGSVEAIKGMVGAGLGLSIVPSMSLPARPRELSVARLSPPLSRSLALILRRDKPLTRGLREVVRAVQDQATARTKRARV